MTGKTVPALRSFWLAVLPAAAGLAFMSYHGHALSQHSATPWGILNLELPHTSERVAHILMAWQEKLVELAIENTIIDFLFIAVYGFCFAYLYRWVAAWRGRPWNRMARHGRWMVLLMASMDVLENSGMLFWLLTGRGNGFSAAAVTLFSAIKWLLVGYTIFFLLGAKLFGGKHESKA